MLSLCFVTVNILINIYIFITYINIYIYTHGCITVLHINSWKWDERWKGSVRFTCWKSLPNHFPLTDHWLYQWLRECLLSPRCSHCVACFSDRWQIQWKWCGHISNCEESCTPSYMFQSFCILFLFFLSAVCLCELHSCSLPLKIWQTRVWGFISLKKILRFVYFVI